jgi:hypothetical protein
VNLSGVTLSGHVASTAASDEGYPGSGMGGAVRNLSGSFAATNCNFVGNAARELTAMAKGSGGALYGSGQVILERCGFSGNQALGGPSLFIQAPGNDGTGGAIHNDGQLVAKACTFANNTATGGAAYIGMGYGSPGGSALGGAIYNAGTLVLSGSTIANNSACGASGGPGYTGGVFQDQGLPGGNGNSGGRGDGGALYNTGTASLINCTIAGNAGIGGGGGQGGQGGSGYNWGGPGGNGGPGGHGLGGVDGTCNLTNCTLAFNGGFPGSGGSGGPGGTGRFGNGGSGLPGSSGNAWGGTTCSALVNTLIASNSPAGNDSFPDPRLGPLTNNGGPTPTMALLPGSPAIDAGNTAAAPTTDQRGQPRPVGLAADIGAYEYGTTPQLRIGLPQPSTVEVRLSDASGPSCRWFTSTGFTDWQCVATNPIGTNGTVLFQDNCGTGETRRFYRVAVP